MTRQSAKTVIVLLAVVAAAAPFAWSSQQAAPSGTVPVSIVVSVEAKHGKEIPTIYRDDVMVFHDRERLQVTEWTPLQGEKAGQEIFLLMDDMVDTNIGLQFSDLKKFITGLPANIAVGVGYIRYGSVNIVQNLTRDHALAAKALRLPMGSTGGAASPYLAITDLIKHWPASGNGREILLISPGIDIMQPGPTNSYLDETIDRAQRAGIPIFSIYFPASGHFGHSMWRYSWGQNNLSKLADETGAEAYYLGFGAPVSFSPYLRDYASRLKSQYRLTFLAKPEKDGGYQRIDVRTEVPDAELEVPDRVYVPAAK